MQVTPEMARAAWQRWLEIEKRGGMDRDTAMRHAVQAALDAAGDIDLPVTATVRVQIDEPAFHASVTEAVNRLHAGLPRDDNGRITIASLQGKPGCCVCGSPAVAHRNYLNEPLCNVCAITDRPKATGGLISGPGPSPRAGCLGQGYLVPERHEPEHRTTVTVNLGGDMTPKDDGVSRVVRTAPRGDAGEPAAPDDGDPYRPTPRATIPDDLLSTDGFEDVAAMAVQPVPHRIPVTEPRPAATLADIAIMLGVQPSTVMDWIAASPRNRFPAPVFTSHMFEHNLYDPDAVKAWHDAHPQPADG